jgi:hypothetical protein
MGTGGILAEEGDQESGQFDQCQPQFQTNCTGTSEMDI